MVKIYWRRMFSYKEEWYEIDADVANVEFFKPNCSINQVTRIDLSGKDLLRLKDLTRNVPIIITSEHEVSYFGDMAKFIAFNLYPGLW